LNLLGTNYFVDHRRLACQVKCFGSVVVDLSEQVEKAESQNKKIRGFRSSKGDVDSHAKQGTMILDEKIEAESEAAAQPAEAGTQPQSQPAKSHQGKQQPKEGKRQHHQQHGRGKNHNRQNQGGGQQQRQNNNQQNKR
jgi:hypothetical protein